MNILGNLPKKKLIVALNWVGLLLVDDQENIMLELSFPEITELSSKRYIILYFNLSWLAIAIILKFSIIYSTQHTLIQKLYLTTLQREKYEFEGTYAEELAEIVNFIIDELKKLTKYVVAVQHHKVTCE